MDAGAVIRSARERADLSLRELAARAGTSHSALAAYETGRRIPTTATLGRIVAAAGFAVELTLHRLPRAEDRGVELEAVLALAEEFPARHAPDSSMPVFGRSSTLRR